MTKKIMLSKEIEAMRPIWEEFIVKLGYTKEQGKMFADGYEEKLKTLPMLEKTDAIYNQNDECMAAGYKKAGIDEDEALDKFNDAMSEEIEDDEDEEDDE